MANAILSQGVTSPYMNFQFAAGTIDTIPPRYFLHFHQDRSVKKACSFTLEILYAPGNFGEQTASVIHSMLLSSSKQPVYYQYGYKTNGGPIVQKQCYTGIFTTYTETIHEGWLTYTISGISSAVEDLNPTVCIVNYLAELKDKDTPIQPSQIADDLVRGNGAAASVGISKYFKDFDIVIHDTDEQVDPHSINISNGSLHDIFCGTSKSDGTVYSNGLVNYSYRNFVPNQNMSSSLLSNSDITNAIGYNFMNRYNSSGMNDILKSKKDVHDAWKNLQKMPFVCYFDNVVSGMGSSKNGSFHYVEKFNVTSVKDYTFEFGNSFLNSDVLSFDVTLDCAPAIASVPALKVTTSDIDANGESIGANYNALQTDLLAKNTYNTPSGFKESAFLSTTTLASALNFPFEATMTVLGQIEPNQLLDSITVNVMVNGVRHDVMSGKYTILGIEDDLSDGGFTTTFRLLKDTWAVSNSDISDVYTSESNKSKENEKALKNDYK